MEFNKRGFAPTIMLMAFVFIALFLVIFTGVSYYGLNRVDESILSIDSLTIGDTNFTQAYEDTTKIGIDSMLSTASYSSVILLLGTIVVMILIGYHYRGKNSNLWILMDIFIIIVSFIAAVYISSTFETFINSGEEIFDIFSGELEIASRFILNLPLVIPIIGILIMFATYITPKRNVQETLNFAGG